SLRETIDLVHRDSHGRPHARERPRDETVAGTHPLLAVEDQKGGVRALELAPHAPRHTCRELIARALHTGEVDEHHLAVAARMDPADRPPGRLWSVGDDRH